MLKLNQFIMKKLKLTKTLKINKETINKLQDEQLKKIQGGKLADTSTCRSASCNICPVTGTGLEG